MSSRRQSGVPAISWPVALLVGVVLFLLGLWLGPRWFGPTTPDPAASGEASQAREGAPSPVVAESQAAPDLPEREAVPEPMRQEAVEVGPVVAVPPGERARIALLIDDLGRSVGDLDALDALGVPLSYAVLPFETRTADVVAEIRRRGGELLLHLPMQPQSGANPGPGALTADMSSTTMRQATIDALAAVPGAVGVNNHMGSVLSTDRRAMDVVLGVVAESGLFYVDSRTSAETVGYRRAIELGVPAAERQVFLDTAPEFAAVEEQFDRLLSVARERGAALAIGHPHPATLEVLARRVPEALALGYEFVPVSFLLDRVVVTPQ